MTTMYMVRLVERFGPRNHVLCDAHRKDAGERFAGTVVSVKYIAPTAPCELCPRKQSVRR